MGQRPLDLWLLFTHADERPGGEKLAQKRLGERDRHGEQQLDRAVAALFRPQAHRRGRHEEQVHPRVPDEEGREDGLSALIVVGEAEREESHEDQEGHEEHVGDGRVEVALELAPDTKL